MADTQLDTLTLKEFAEQLKALLRRASDSGLDVNEFCELAESILDTGWAE